MFSIGDKVRFQHLGQDVIGEVDRRDGNEFRVAFNTDVEITKESGKGKCWWFNSIGQTLGQEEYGTVLTKVEDKMEIKLNRSYWQEGAEVYCLRFGHTKISRVGLRTFPIKTEYGSYTPEGSLYHRSPRTLFYKKAITFDEQGRPIAINWNYVPPHLNKPIFDHTRHKEMWNMLAENVITTKTDYFSPLEEMPKNECFACETTVIAAGFLDCDKCPFGQFEKFKCLKGLFDTWVCTNNEARKVIAKAIADYPLCETNSKLYNII